MIKLLSRRALSFYWVDLANDFLLSTGEEKIDTMGLRSEWYLYLASLLIGISFVMGCAGHDHQHRDEPLPPPVYADSETAQAMKEGNRLFKERRWWRDAAEQCRIAIQAFPTMPEAHYNLGLALKKLGLYKKARVHFREH